MNGRFVLSHDNAHRQYFPHRVLITDIIAERSFRPAQHGPRQNPHPQHYAKDRELLAYFRHALTSPLFSSTSPQSNPEEKLDFQRHGV